MKQEGVVFLFVLCLIVYAVILKYSFIISTCALTTVTLIFQKTKKKSYYAISIAVVFIMFYIFKELLNVRLP